MEKPSNLQTRGTRDSRTSFGAMKPTRVQQAINILNSSADETPTDLNTVIKSRPKKNPKVKPQSKKRVERK